MRNEIRERRDKREKADRVNRIKRVLVFLPIILSVFAMIIAFITFLSVKDINRRLKSVSLNSYVEQTVVSNNYIVGSRDRAGKDGNVYFGDSSDKGYVDDGAVNVYLTFDDGPSSNTAEILDILKRHNVRATFFVNGVAASNPALEPLYKAIVADGNAIGMHSYTHKYSEIYSSAEAFEADLDKIHSLIYNETGVDTKLYRFPGGTSNTVSKLPMSTFADIIHKNGYEYYDWNIYPGDSSGRSYPKEAIISGVLGNISEYRSAIILLHDSDNHNSTVEALPEIVEGLLAQGARFNVIDEYTPIIQQISY